MGVLVRLQSRAPQRACFPPGKRAFLRYGSGGNRTHLAMNYWAIRYLPTQQPPESYVYMGTASQYRGPSKILPAGREKHSGTAIHQWSYLSIFRTRNQPSSGWRTCGGARESQISRVATVAGGGGWSKSESHEMGVRWILQCTVLAAFQDTLAKLGDYQVPSGVWPKGRIQHEVAPRA